MAEALGGEKKADQCAPAFKALVDQAGIDRSLSGNDIKPDDLVRVMMSQENLPMIDNNARPISTHDGLELARRTLNR